MPTEASEVISEPISQLGTEGDVADLEHAPAPAVRDWVAGAEDTLGYQIDAIPSRVVAPASIAFQDRIDEMKRRWSGVSETEFSVWADVVAEDDRAAEQASAEVWPAE